MGANSKCGNAPSSWNTYASTCKATLTYRYFTGLLIWPTSQVRQFTWMKLCPFMVIVFQRSFNAALGASRFRCTNFCTIHWGTAQNNISNVSIQQSKSTGWKYLLMAIFYTVIQISFSSNSPENKYFRQYIWCQDTLIFNMCNNLGNVIFWFKINMTVKSLHLWLFIILFPFNDLSI